MLYGRTEAHPILLRNRAPGVDSLWSGPGATDEDLGQRAFGTDAQLWERYKLIQQEQERIERLKHKSNPGGHGKWAKGPSANALELKTTSTLLQEWEVVITDLCIDLAKCSVTHSHDTISTCNVQTSSFISNRYNV